jgi:hypothetical protein
MQRDEFTRELASIDRDALDPQQQQDLEATLDAGYPVDVVVPLPKAWADEVQAVGFQYSDKAPIPWEGGQRESRALVEKQSDKTRRRVTTVVASIASPDSAQWNNCGIGHAWLRELDDAQRAFNAAVAVGAPKPDAELARDNRRRLQKLKAADVLRRAAGG